MWRYVNQKLAFRQMGAGEVRLKMDKSKNRENQEEKHYY